jgi:endoglucanase
MDFDHMNRRLIPILILVCALTACARKTPAPVQMPAQSSFADFDARNPMVHQIGRTLVGTDGKPLRLRGVNLGGWLLWEGGDFGKAILLSESTLFDRLAQVVGNQGAQDFRNQIYANFITAADFQRIAQLGFNSVRLPINANILEDDARPYVYKQSGWDLIDHALSWGEQFGVYVIIDLHAVPGGQSRLSPSDPGRPEEIIWKSEAHKQRTIALWQAIASRYKDRQIVAGYDLINEPLPPKGSDLFDLEQRLVAAIRQVDRQHLVIIEGDKFSSDFSMFATPLSGNQMYGFHMYNWFGDDRKNKIAGFKQLSLEQNVPLWAGEFGENTVEMIASTVAMYNDPANEILGGWSFWTWKKVPTRWPTLLAITPPAGWQPLLDWLNKPNKNVPDRAQSISGLNEFVRAARLENTTLDQAMLDALRNTSPSSVR